MSYGTPYDLGDDHRFCIKLFPLADDGGLGPPVWQCQSLPPPDGPPAACPVGRLPETPGRLTIVMLGEPFPGGPPACQGIEQHTVVEIPPGADPEPIWITLDPPPVTQWRIRCIFGFWEVAVVAAISWVKTNTNDDPRGLYVPSPAAPCGLPAVPVFVYG